MERRGRWSAASGCRRRTARPLSPSVETASSTSPPSFRPSARSARKTIRPRRSPRSRASASAISKRSWPTRRRMGAIRKSRGCLRPLDLQTLKAAGVTFAISMLERVIEERAKGNPASAEAIRKEVTRLIGDDLSKLKPGSRPGDASEAGADRSERLEPISRSRHRSGCRGLHQGADPVVGRHRHGCRAASEVDLEQSRAGARAVRLEPRQDRRRRARQRRQSARLRGPLGAAACRRPRTTTPPARSARCCVCSTTASHSTTRASSTSA